MKAINVRQLKNNPSEALRLAREDMVVVMNRDKPDALLVHLDDQALLSLPGVRTALATALFKEGNLSLGRAAKLAEMSLVDFIQCLSRQGIPVIHGEREDVEADRETLEAWLDNSS